MKRLLTLVWFTFFIIDAFAGRTYVDRYRLRLRLKVPVIVDNMDSLGARVYKRQVLKGALIVQYIDSSVDPVLEVEGLYNKNYKIRGRHVTYKVTVSEVLWRAVGDNKKNKFKTAACGFKLEADPSYNIGDDEPDNTLILTLAGYGSAKKVSGYASGQIGCGCGAYGHVSPTRIMYCPYVSSKWPFDGCRWWYPTVDDIAPCWGSWTIRFLSRSVSCVDTGE